MSSNALPITYSHHGDKIRLNDIYRKSKGTANHFYTWFENHKESLGLIENDDYIKISNSNGKYRKYDVYITPFACCLMLTTIRTPPSFFIRRELERNHIKRKP